MTGGVFSRTMITAFAVVMLVAPVSGKDSPQESDIANPHVARAMQYVFPDETRSTAAPDRSAPAMSLGGAGVATASPGVKVGETWYDQQRNGSMGRMVDWGWGPDLGDGMDYGFAIHYCYMQLPGPVLEDYHIYYNCYMGQTGTQLYPGLGVSVQSPSEYAAGGGLDVTQMLRTEGETILQAANQAVIICHNNQGSGCASQVYYDYCPMCAYFGLTSRVPDSVQSYPAMTGNSASWPAMRYHDVAGHEPVTHVIAQSSSPGAGDQLVIYYFRKVGIGMDGAWDYPPYVIDTIYDLSQDVACSMTDGKMALVWTGNLPNDGDCDTCSGTSPFVQLDNDIYYQISDNYGADFNPRVNVTKNVDGEAGFRPYTDLSALITQDAANGVNALHIGWSGRIWPADAGSGGYIGLNCRMFHWGENLGTGGFDGPDPQTDNAIIRTAGNLDWNQTTCNGGAWQMNGSKMTISECNGRLYYLWVQFNDPNIMMDDCAARAQTGDVVGSANGELYLAVSDDGGLTWDLPRNLTNSHTPGCDSASGTGGRCESDHWPSMARFGTNIVGDDMTGAEILLPAGDLAVDNGWYMSVQYISDPDAGAIVQNEGSWQNANVQSFQLVCVDPEATPLLAPSWTSIGFPSWSHQYVIHDTDLVLENTGNSAATFTVTPEEDEGPAGWLDVSGNLQGTVVLPSGLAGIMTGQVYINALGTVGGDPGMVTILSGRLIIGGNHVTGPDTIEIEHRVVDTVITPVWDTIYAGDEDACMALTVGNNGNWGQQGIGQVNMDYFDYGDCDDAEEGSPGDTIPGNATIYVNDASPVICWMDATDTVRCNWSIFGDGYLSDNGFFPWSHTPPTDMGDYEVFQSSFVTRDSGIMFENNWIAPRAAVDSCHFLIQYMKVYAQDGETHEGLAIGEAIDWDIPSDSAARNRCGFDPGLRLIYQQGSEWDQDDAYECMNNSDRYGGIELLQILENGEPAGEQYGCYTMDNSTQVYPAGAFVPDSIYMYMANNEGYVLSDSVDADLHAVMTFRWDYTLGPDDTLEVYKCMITSNVNYAAFIADAEACHQWYDDHIRPEPVYVCGDVNDDSRVNVGDITYLVAYLFGSGPPPPIMEAADMDGVPGVDVGDLTYLVGYLFQGGPPPPPPIGGKQTSRSTQPGGNVYLDYVDGLYHSSRYIRAGEPITFHIRVSNVIATKGTDIPGLTNGFRIYSPTGTPISVSSAVSTSGFDDSTSLDGGRFVNSFGASGDTTGFGGYALQGVGVPNGLDIVAYTITLDPIDAKFRGAEVCLDSTWYPPSNEWIWATGSETYVPDWGGPYCFTVVDPIDLVADFTATPTAGDTSTVFQFYADTTGAPDWWDWDFGDGQHSSVQNPTHKYGYPGRFEVTLTVRNAVEESNPHKKLEFIQVRNILWSDLYAEVNINAWGSRPGYDIWYWCSFHNAGNLPAEDCTLKVLLPAAMAFEGIRDSSGAVINPGQYSFVGDTIVMSLGTIEPSNDWNRIVPYGTLSSQVTPGFDTLVTEMWLSTTTADGNSRNDYVRHAQIVTNPSKSGTRTAYSADKLASPNGTNLAYAIEPDQRLSYTIAFENAAEATAPISSIEIVDTLDVNLDWSSSSLSIGEMSHPEACRFVGFDVLTGELTWYCDKIYLPPNVSPPDGEGYITYSVNPDQGLMSGAEIINFAYLKFGFDSPVQAPGPAGLYRRIGECCIPPIRGDINYDNAVLIDIADLVYLVDYMFNQGPAPVCFDESDVNGDGGGVLAIDDLVYLVDFMFNGDPPPVSCP